MNKRFSAMLGGIAVAVACLAAVPAHAQTYPAKPVRLILPFPPGGPTDLLGRAVAQKLGEQIGQTVVVDNRGGAGGNVGGELAAKSPPDGYTLVLTSPFIAISPSLYSKLNYDPIKDLAPISLVAIIQNVLLVHPSLPVKTLKEFVALAKARPGALNYASGGAGTTTHLAGELLKVLTNTNIVHVPYKGTGLALQAMVGGQVEMLIMAVPAAAPMIQANRVRPLAVLSPQRDQSIANVPTAKEAGIDGLDVSIWYGILGPSGLPNELITRLNGELVKAMRAPEMKEKLSSIGVEPMTNTPGEFAQFIRSEAARYGKVIKAANIKPE